MLKIILGAAAVGVFVGALTSEVIKHVRPDLLESIEKKAKDTASAFVAAFKSGYRNSSPDESG